VRLEFPPFLLAITPETTIMNETNIPSADKAERILDDSAKEILLEYISIVPVQNLLTTLRSNLALWLADGGDFENELKLSLPYKERRKDPEGEEMLDIALAIAGKRAQLECRMNTVDEEKNGQFLLHLTLSQQMETALLAMVKRCEDLRTRFRRSLLPDGVAEPAQSPFTIPRNVKHDYGPTTHARMEPSRDGAMYYRDLRNNGRENIPEPIAPPELERRTAIVAWAKGQNLSGETYEECIALSAIENTFRSEVTAVVEEITNGSISFADAAESPKMVPKFALPIEGSIPGITQNLRFPDFGNVCTTDLIARGEALLPDLFRTFDPATQNFSKFITRCLPSRLITEMRKTHRGSEPTSKEAERMNEKNAHARKGRVVQWAKTQGIPVNSFDELFRNARGVSHFWHLAQVATNEAANLFPPPQNGMDYAHYNLVTISSLQHAFHTYEPEVNGDFEKYALELIFTELIMSLEDHETRDRSKFTHELEVMRTAGIPAELAKRAKNYARIRDLADSVKLPKIAVESTQEKTKPLRELQKLLVGCSRQERIIVILHQKKNSSFQQISEIIGLEEKLVKEIYKAVCDGKRGGNTVATESSERIIPQRGRLFAKPKTQVAPSPELPASELPSLVSVLTSAQANALSELRTDVVDGIKKARISGSPATLVTTRRAIKVRLEKIGYPVPKGADAFKTYTVVAKQIMNDPDPFFDALVRLIGNE